MIEQLYIQIVKFPDDLLLNHKKNSIKVFLIYKNIPEHIV